MPPEYTNEQEWRDLILREIRDLKEEFHTFQLETVTEAAENRGAQKTSAAVNIRTTAVISLIITALVQIVVAYIRK